MLHFEAYNLASLRLAGINRLPTHTMQHRSKAHLVLNRERRDRVGWLNHPFVFGRSWDHDCLQNNKKDASIVMTETHVRDSYTGLTAFNYGAGLYLFLPTSGHG